jgi:hypothetical protein
MKIEIVDWSMFIFQSERKLATPTSIKDGEIFRVGLTRLRFGGVKNNQVAVVAAAAKG